MKLDYSELPEAIIEFHHEFSELFDELIAESIEAGMEDYKLEPSQAASIVMTKVMYFVIIMVLDSGEEIDGFLDTSRKLFHTLKLARAEPEGGIQ